jgi:hypothetical protein
VSPTENADLFRLVYQSRSALTGSGEEVQRTIDRILAVSRRRNAEAGVTGALMFTRLYFVQALEGPAAAVESVFDRICCDLRHTGIEVIECGPVLETTFGGWSMSELVPDADAGALLDHVKTADELAETAAAAMRLMAALLRSKTARGSAAPEREAR